MRAASILVVLILAGCSKKPPARAPGTARPEGSTPPPVLPVEPPPEDHEKLCDEALKRKDFDEARRQLTLGGSPSSKVDDAEYAHWMAEWRRLAVAGDWPGVREAASRAARLKRGSPAELRSALDAARAALRERRWRDAGDALKRAIGLDETSPEVEAARLEIGAALTAAMREARDRREWAAAFEILRAAEPAVSLPGELRGEIGYEFHMADARPAYARQDFEVAHRSAQAARAFLETEELKRILERTTLWMRRGQEAWTAKTDGAVVAAPAWWNGRLCLGDEAGVAYVGGPDHEGLSDFKVGAPIRAEPVVSGNTLYLGSVEGTLLVADLATLNGKVVKPDRPLGEIRGLAFAGGTLYVWAGDACAAVNPASGTVAWVSADAASRPVVHGDHVLVRTSKGLAALDRKTGRIASTTPDASGEPLVVGGLAVIPCGRILRAKAWELRISAEIVRLVANGSGVGALGADGKLRLVSSDGRLEAEVALDRRLDTALAIDSGVLYAGSGNDLVAYDLSGRPLWTYAAGARVTAPLVAGGRVWFGTAAGRVIAVHPDR